MPDAFLDHWKMYFDGSLKLGRAGASILFISLEGKQLKYVLQILWQATNNEAEYEALIHGLRIVTSLEIKWLIVYGDSAMVINQVNKDWGCTKDNMDTYCAKVQKLEKNLQGLEILHVLRDSNVETDVLAKLGLDRAKVPKNRTIRGGRSITHLKIRTRQYRRSQSKCYPSVSSMPPRLKMPLQQKYSTMLRPGTTKNTKD
jgi:ribonuclease HI